MMRNSAAVVVLALTLGACASVHTPMRPAYADETVRPIPPAMIIGHGTYHVKGGHGSCIGQSVALMRDTPAFRHRIVTLYGSSEHALQSVKEVQTRSAKLGEAEENPLVQSVQCAANASFVFPGLQPGAYFIIARVRHIQPHAAAEDYVVMDRVYLNEGETRTVELTP
jgi:hypothetical protein